LGILSVFIGEEALAGLAAESTGEGEPSQLRGGTVALLVALLDEGVEDAEHLIKPDFIGPRERPAGMVEPVDEASVDVLGAANALAQGERGLIYQLADDAAE